MEVEDLCLGAEAHTQRPGGSDWLKETANRGENKMQIAKPSRKWLWGGGGVFSSFWLFISNTFALLLESVIS